MRPSPATPHHSTGLLTMTLVLGFASGLPLALSAGTLQAWLTVEGVDLKTLGWLTLLGMPYTYKFAWAPMMDRYPVGGRLGGRRRGWMVLLLLTMAALLMGLSLQPAASPEGLIRIAVLGLLLVVASASFDIVFDAWRAEAVPAPQRGLAAAWSVLGYRLAMLTSGALALILADLYLGFAGVYQAMAGLLVLLAAVAAWTPETQEALQALQARPASLWLAMADPFREFFSRRGAILILVTIALYKLGDAFAGSLSTAFLIRGAGFSPAEVGAVNKGVGLVATLGGALAGGWLLSKIGLIKALIGFGILQAVTNLGFWWLSTLASPDLSSLTGVVLLENLAGGMGTAAFVALLMGLCDLRYTATQFALLSALASLGRVWVGPVAGEMASTVGWPTFFLASTAAAVPGIILLWAIRSRLEGRPSPPEDSPSPATSS